MLNINRVLLFVGAVAWIAAAIQYFGIQSGAIPDDGHTRCMLAFDCTYYYGGLPLSLPAAFYLGLSALLVVAWRTFVARKPW